MKFFKPEVVRCVVSECSYNKDHGCHALSISIGGPHQECDTFVLNTDKKVNDGKVSNVGICKVPSCSNNKDSLCKADNISVGWHGNHADCITYSIK